MDFRFVRRFEFWWCRADFALWGLPSSSPWIQHWYWYSQKKLRNSATSYQFVSRNVVAGLQAFELRQLGAVLGDIPPQNVSNGFNFNTTMSTVGPNKRRISCNPDGFTVSLPIGTGSKVMTEHSLTNTARLDLSPLLMDLQPQLKARGTALDAQILRREDVWYLSHQWICSLVHLG